MTTLEKTTRNKLTAIVNKYILECIDSDGYDIETTTDRGKLQFLADCFTSEYCFPDNLKRYGSYQNCLKEWIMGLPSSFNVDFENYRIIEIAKEWGSIPQDADDRQEDKILNNWFNLIAAKTIMLMNKNGINLK